MKFKNSWLLVKLFLALFIGALLFLLTTHKVISSYSGNFLYKNLESIPYNKTGIVLGTAKYLRDGRINLYYQYRLDAIYQLYKNDKIAFILVSGDNSTPQYNEPQTFKADLMQLGVPEEKIYLDYAGFRTLDSIVRAHAIFGLQSFTIVSQEFHNERAIFIAKNKKLEAIGFNALDVALQGQWKMYLREVLARTNMLLDLYLLDTQPKYFGERIDIK